MQPEIKMKMTLSFDFGDQAEAAMLFDVFSETFSRLKAAAGALMTAAAPAAKPAPFALAQAKVLTASDVVPQLPIASTEGAAAVSVPTSPAAEAQPEGERRKRRTKAEMEAARAAEAQTETSEQPVEAAPELVTLDMLRTIGNQVAQKISGPKVLEILQQFGSNVKRYPDIPEDKRGEALAKFKQALAGAAA